MTLHGKNLGDEHYKMAGYIFPNLGSGAVTAFYGYLCQIFGSRSAHF
ncbi:MAG: hypothetical protein M3O07_01310 [Pseudomonadota bacterium]|nr:hypothetical protein [Pseudomonadota bacterium]